jgi:hypothetical protein
MVTSLLVYIFLNGSSATNCQPSTLPLDTLPLKKEYSRRLYCCTFCEAKYEIIQRKQKLTINWIYKEKVRKIEAKLVKGKIYSDDPNEKEYKQQGMLYILKGKLFRVKHIENGEYDDYTLCK